MYGLNSSIADGGGEAAPETLRQKMEHLCRFLKSWRRKTKGERIRCQRHHLKNDVLSGFLSREIRLAIALAKLDRDGGEFSGSAEELLKWVAPDLEGRDLQNVIFDFNGFEEHLWAALEKLEGGGAMNRVG